MPCKFLYHWTLIMWDSFKFHGTWLTLSLGLWDQNPPWPSLSLLPFSPGIWPAFAQTHLSWMVGLTSAVGQLQQHLGSTCSFSGLSFAWGPGHPHFHIWKGETSCSSWVGLKEAEPYVSWHLCLVGGSLCHPRVLFATLCLLAGSAGDGLDSCGVPQPHPQRASCLKLGRVPGSSQRVYSLHVFFKPFTAFCQLQSLVLFQLFCEGPYRLCAVSPVP